MSSLAKDYFGNLFLVCVVFCMCVSIAWSFEQELKLTRNLRVRVNVSKSLKRFLILPLKSSCSRFFLYSIILEMYGYAQMIVLFTLNTLWLVRFPDSIREFGNVVTSVQIGIIAIYTLAVYGVAKIKH